jgi:hypothetical protein
VRGSRNGGSRQATTRRGPRARRRSPPIAADGVMPRCPGRSAGRSGRTGVFRAERRAGRGAPLDDMPPCGCSSRAQHARVGHGRRPPCRSQSRCWPGGEVCGRGTPLRLGMRRPVPGGIWATGDAGQPGPCPASSLRFRPSWSARASASPSAFTPSDPLSDSAQARGVPRQTSLRAVFATWPRTPSAFATDRWKRCQSPGARSTREGLLHAEREADRRAPSARPIPAHP